MARNVIKGYFREPAESYNLKDKGEKCDRKWFWGIQDFKQKKITSHILQMLITFSQDFLWYISDMIWQ